MKSFVWDCVSYLSVLLFFHHFASHVMRKDRKKKFSCVFSESGMMRRRDSFFFHLSHLSFHDCFLGMENDEIPVRKGKKERKKKRREFNCFLR